MIKLHLGCGKKIIKDHINIDAIQVSKEIAIDDVATLNTISNETVDQIYACHVLEHFGRHEYTHVLKAWFSKLKPGGILFVAVPDFDAIISRYNETKNIDELIGLCWGGQKNEYDYHKIGFNMKSLTKDLCSAGFVDIEKYDWRSSEYAGFDDYSKSYLPHMDFVNGTLMSLNVKAKKSEK